MFSYNNIVNIVDCQLEDYKAILQFPKPSFFLVFDKVNKSFRFIFIVPIQGFSLLITIAQFVKGNFVTTIKTLLI